MINPQAAVDDGGTPAADSTLDMRNNVVWNWGRGGGTLVRNRALVDLVDDVYGSPSSPPVALRRAIVVCGAVCSGQLGWPGHAWVAGNVGLAGAAIPPGTEAGPFPAAPVTMQDAYTAAVAVVLGAGAQPRDVADAALASEVQLAGCQSAPAAPAPAPPPAAAQE